MQSDNPPDSWKLLSNNFKDLARGWFIKRAENVGIDWYGLVSENKKDMTKLKEFYETSSDNDIIYPSYYVQAFHGYDTGNLNWDAALEGEAATLSMAISYWKEANPIVTQDWLRYNVSNNIKNYVRESSPYLHIDNIVDIGCSVGISTEFLYKTFREATNISGVDLSPFFIAMAKLRAENFNFPIQYFHKNAEDMNIIPDSSQELVVCNFIMHELPEEATINVINEAYRILKPGGVIAIVDLTPRVINNNFLVSKFRKWAFEVTEPHIYGYYKRNLSDMLKNAKFHRVDNVKNDPINSIWMGSKLENIFTEYDYYEGEYEVNDTEKTSSNKNVRDNNDETLLKYTTLEYV
tara:strand:- start:3880 stop:4929 length:1050 start_codon:yes stop_codon:yes gene_type:complete